MRFTDRLQGVLIRKEARVEFTHTEEWVQDLFYILVNLFPWVSLALYNGCHKVSAIYLYPACRSGRTSCSLTTIWSNTISLTSLLQKTWWQRKFLCFNKDQSKEFIEPLDLLSSPWARLLHPDHQAVPWSFQVTFCLSCIKKLLFLDCSLFCAVSWIPLQSDWLLSYTWPVTLWGIPCSHLNNLLPTFSPYICFFYFMRWMQKFL